MAKRGLLVLVLAAVVAGGAFAQISFSVGGGGFIGGDFGGGAEASESGVKFTMETPHFGGGGYIFVDATYAELSLGIFGGSGDFKQTVSYGGYSESSNEKYSLTSFNIGLLGKYPFQLGDNLTLFPLLGIDYQVVLSVKDKNGDEVEDEDGNKMASDYSSLWFKFGAGMDYAFTSNIFLRGEFLYGIRIPNKAENDMVSMAKDYMGFSNAKTRLGHGLTVRLAIGYRF